MKQTLSQLFWLLNILLNQLNQSKKESAESILNLSGQLGDINIQVWLTSA
jgi:hypothetical protein